jgi:deoxyribodipyrimidine photo-lyase
LRSGVLLTEEDLSPGFLLDALDGPPVAHAALISVAGRSPRAVAPQVMAFTEGAVADALGRWAGRFGDAGPMTRDPDVIADWAATIGLEQVVTAHAPVGPAASALHRLDTALADRGIGLVRVLRGYDQRAWPHATHGFFRFKEAIPELIAAL